MAYTDDAVRAKLSSLNETQESIVSVSQWIMFHRRHADKTAQLWLQRIGDLSSTKKLNLIYLANEVVQQSKARKKTEFVSAFSPIIAEGTALAYKGASGDIQQKIRRVIEVWRGRQIFDQPVQEAVEGKVDDIDRTRGTTKKAGLGGSLFSSGSAAPPELAPLIPLQSALTRQELAAKPAYTNAVSEFDKVMDPSIAIPAPPVHAHHLSGVLKTLANAEGAVAEGIKARRALVEGLEKLLETNRTALRNDESQQFDLSSKRTSVEAKKREVEDNIMRDLSAEQTNTDAPATTEGAARPDVEQLTPPPTESLTPVGSPPPMMPYGTTAAENLAEKTNTSKYDQDPNLTSNPIDGALPSASPVPGADLLSSLAAPMTRPRSSEGPNGSTSLKRRKLSGSAGADEYADFVGGDAMEGLDAEVAEILERE